MTILKTADLWAPSPSSPFAWEVYIETGVGYGDSLKEIAKVRRFEKLIGIEVNKDAVTALSKNDELMSDDRIVISCGPSTAMLPELIDPSRRTIFFLDSHFEPGVEASWDGVHQCPLLAELRIILGFQWKDKPLILIDDYAIFMSDLWWVTYAHKTHYRSHWPTMQQIFDTFRGLEYKWNFTAATNGILYCW